MPSTDPKPELTAKASMAQPVSQPAVYASGLSVCCENLNPSLLLIPDLSRARYKGADKSLAPPGRKQATATEDFEFHISYLLS
jgi:hypothetical protein